MDLHIIFFILFTICYPSFALIQFSFKHVTLLDENQLESFKTSPNVRGIYYYHRDLPRLRAFFKELDQSAGYLDPYGVRIGILDCNALGQVEECKTKNTDNIYTYRDGNELLNLELETMFDVNSIMSNILQLVLLREVPILQTKEERVQFQEKHSGSHNIVFSYQKAIGTFDHRIFMEVAYAYQDQFKFALATAKESAEDLQDSTDIAEREFDSAIWILYCKDVARQCDSVRYMNKMDLVTLAQYIRALTLPKTFDFPGDGPVIPYTSNGMHIVYMYYDSATKQGVSQIAEALAEEVHGVVGLVTVDTELAPLLEDHGCFRSLPGLGLKLKMEDKLICMDTDWKTESIRQFLFDNLYKKLYDTNDEKPDYSQENLPLEAGPENAEGETEQEYGDDYRPPNVEEVETQDDQVAEAVFRMRKTRMDLELVPALTDKTFPQTLQEKDFIFVLFFLPIDARSMAFLRAYGEASRVLVAENGTPLAQVNCYHWTDVCAKQNITQYPTVHIYRKGKDLQVYKGTLGTRAIVSAVRLLQVPDIIDLTSEEEVDRFVAGGLPADASDFTQTSVIGLFDDSHSKEKAAYKDLASLMHGQFLFGMGTSKSVTQMAQSLGVSVPAVVVSKRDDPYQPRAAFSNDFTVDSLKDFVLRSSIPVLPELTAGLFPLLHRKQQPFVVLFSDSGDRSQETKDVMGHVVTSGKFQDLLFTWMDVTNSTSVGKSVMEKYIQDPAVLPPALSLVKLQKGSVYNLAEEIFTFESVTAWLTQIQSGSLKATTLLPEAGWKPLQQGYNFLQMMDHEAGLRSGNHESSQSSAIRAAEVHGIGFDTEGNIIGKDSEEVNAEQVKDEEELEARQELLELRNSRLFHHSKERKVDHHEGDMGQMDESGMEKVMDRTEGEMGQTADEVMDKTKGRDEL